jgi:hypothetical protein
MEPTRCAPEDGGLPDLSHRALLPTPALRSKITLCQLMTELAEDEGLSAADRARAKEIADASR